MKPRAWLLAVLVISGFASRAWSAAADDFASVVENAKKLGAESSWARAQEAFTRAREIAPDADAVRWCDLWIIDAAWRSNGEARNQGDQHQRYERHRAGLDALIAGTRGEQTPDDFWLAAMESRADLRDRNRDHVDGWTDRLAIADALALASPDGAARVRYLAFLHRPRAEMKRNLDGALKRRWLEHLARGAQLAPTPDERATLAIHVAELGGTPFPELIGDTEGFDPAEQQERWAWAREMAHGTAWEAHARAGEFLWRARHLGWATDGGIGTVTDLRRVLDELDEVRRDLRATNAPTVRELLQQLEGLEGEWEFPALEIRVPQVFQPDEPMRFSYGSIGRKEITVSIYRLSVEQWREELQWRPRDQPKRDAWRDGQQVRDWKIPVPFTDDLEWRSEIVDIAPVLSPGAYTLVLDGSPHPGRGPVTRTFVVSGVQGLSIASESGSGRLVFFDARTEQAVGAATMRGAFVEREKETPWNGTTDVEGQATMLLPKADGGYRSMELQAFVGDHPVRLPISERGNRGTALVADLFLPRELYRPGETVPWKLIVREREAGRFVLPEHKLKVAVRLGEETLMPETAIALNEFGTAAGELEVPLTARPGAARMSVAVDDADALSRSWSGSMFRVDHVEPPALMITTEVASAADSMRPGHGLVIRARVNFYSGGPAVGVPVEVRFRAGLPWVRELEPAKRAHFDEWAKALSEQTSAATTDAAGNAEFRLELPADLPDGSSLQCTATAVPDGSRGASSGLTFAVRETGAGVDPLEWYTARLVTPNQPVTFAGRVLDGANRPRAFVGTAQLVERRWVETWLDPEGVIRSGEDAAAARQAAGVPAGGALLVPWQKVYAGEVDRVIAEQELRTADGNFAVTFTPPRDGRYRIQLLRDEAVLSSARYTSADSMLAVVVADESTEKLAFAPDASVLLGAEAVKAGEPLRFLAILPADHHAGWIVVEGEEQIAVQRFATSGRVSIVTVEAPPPFSGRGAARLVVPEASRWEEVRAAFRVEHPGQKLTVAVRAEHTELRPGAESALSVKVSDERGAPVRAELAAGGSDQAWSDLIGGALAGDTTFSSYSAGVRTSVESSREPSRVVARINDPRAGAGSFLDGIIVIPANRSAPSFSMAGMAPEVRRHFDATAFWTARIVTDENGEARVPFKYPDSLTEWRLAAYAVGANGESFGRGFVSTTTTLPLQARLQVPRLLVVGDTAELSGLMLNRTDADFSAGVGLSIAGPLQVVRASAAGFEELHVPKQGEARTAWTVRATELGSATLTLTSTAGAENDAMQLALPVLEDGVVLDAAASGRLARAERRQQLKLALPEKFDRTRTDATIQVSASHAAALLDALPYLIDYPYGCVEQTMNRFLPGVVVKKTLTDFGLATDAIERRILAREASSDVQRRAATAGLDHLDEVVTRSIARLNDSRNYQGFGWWPGARTADLWMTAYVMWGLTLAQESGVTLPPKLVSETRRTLTQQVASTDAMDDRVAWALAALARADVKDDAIAEKFARVYAARDHLSAAGRACLALAAVKFGDDEQRAVLLRNLENGAQRVKASDLGDTVHWGTTGNYWRAMDGAVESTALTLLALLELDPKHPLIEPAVNWLVLNRRSAHWASTRDTAFAILALTKFIATCGELDADAEVDVFANGKKVQRVKFTRESLLAGDTTIAIDSKLLRGGTNTIELRRVGGKSPVYAVALASSWARGDAVKPQGHLINVARGFVRQKQEPTLLGTLRITPEPLPADGKANAAVTGEQVTARVTLNVPNELEYVMVEVPKPAGCEPLNPLSGWDATLRRAERDKGEGAGEEDDGRAIYREEHDDRSVFFIDSLAAGTWEIVFSLRATTPGNYRALPAEASAMYVPEVRANSDAQRVRIERRN